MGKIERIYHENIGFRQLLDFLKTRNGEIIPYRQDGSGLQNQLQTKHQHVTSSSRKMCEIKQSLAEYQRDLWRILWHSKSFDELSHFRPTTIT